MNSDLAPLADAIDTVLARWFNMRTDDLLGGFGPDRTVYRTDIVNAILAMPEMTAIRSALVALDDAGGPGYIDGFLELPLTVVAWVRGAA